MPFFIDTADKLHFLTDADIANGYIRLLPVGCVEITQGEADAIQNPPPTDEQIAAQLETAVDAHIDATAQAKGYDSRITCALRAGYVNPWQTEGAAFGAWMDSCYAYCYQVMADVQNAARTIPTAEELVAELPAMVWP